MKTTCEACHTVYESVGDDPAFASCPCCEHVNRPRGRVESVQSDPGAEITADHSDHDALGDIPVKTILFPADEEFRDTGVTEVKALRAKSRPGLATGVELEVVVIKGARPPERHPITRTRMTIGRGRCDIRLRDPEVSRQHCAVEVLDGVPVLKDLKSANGTLLNGHLILEHVIKDGDEIRIGATRLRIRVSKAA